MIVVSRRSWYLTFLLILFGSCSIETQWKVNTMTTEKNLTENYNTYCTDTNCDDGSNNQTNGPQHRDEVQVISNIDKSWWCPPGYRISNRDLILCDQMSCLTITSSVESLNPGQQPTNDQNKTTETTQVCSPLTRNYQTCSKIPLSPNHYVVMESKRSLWIPKTDIVIPMGDFVIFRNGIAAVCQSDNMTTTSFGPSTDSWYTKETLNAMSPSCMPFKVPFNKFKVMSNGSASAFDDSVSFVSNQFYDTNRSANGSVNVCYEMFLDFISCKPKVIGFRNEYHFLENMFVHELFENGVTIPVGHYMLSTDGQDVITCHSGDINHGENRSETRYVHGISSLLSTICLFLALLAHLFFPQLNYHAKALLCHIISMLVMYLMLVIMNFTDLLFWSDFECYVFFAISYIASLGAFLWLSVLAFDLWRVFANLRGTITPGNTSGKRRKFIFQCVYAWGIPSLICIFLLIADNYYYSLNLRELCWFINNEHMWLFFYAPIVIILLENATFFTLTIMNLRQATKGTDVLNKKVSRQLFEVFAKLFVVMGLCWFAEVISFVIRGDDRWYYVTDAINGLQGVAIFIVYVCKKSTLTAIKTKLGYAENSQATQSSSTQVKGRKISDASVNAVSRNGLEMNRVSAENVQQTGVYRQSNEV